MPINIESFATEFMAATTRCDVKFPEGFIPKFVLDTKQALQSLTRSSENHDILSGFGAYVVVASLQTNLQCKCITQFLADEGIDRIKQHVLNAFNTALNNAAPGKNLSGRDDVNLFIQRKLNYWAAQIISKTNIDFFDLNIIFVTLAEEITQLVVKALHLGCGYDVYSIFETKLKKQFSAFIPYVQVETDITSLIDIIKKFMPSATKPDSHEGDYSSNPGKLLMSININSGHQVAQAFNAEYLAPRLSAKLPQHIQHQNRIIAGCNNLTPTTADELISLNFIAIKKVKAQLRRVSHNEAPGWLGHWLAEQNTAWAIPMTLAYKDGSIVKKIENLMFDRWLEQLQPYYTLPEILRNPPVVAASTAKPCLRMY